MDNIPDNKLDHRELPWNPVYNITPAPEPRWGKASSTPEEQKFLEGPQPRRFELLRALRIFRELIRGFRQLHFLGPCITVFGSARFPETHPYYAQARRLGALLARAGFTVITGGGPGIMEAANRGAKDVNGRSVGCNITLPTEQKPNPYLDRFVEFRYFFIRKVMLVKYSYGFVAAPGGFGTMDELFEVTTLIQTGKIQNYPVVLFGVEYWTPLLTFLRQSMLANQAIDERDLANFVLTDSPEEAASCMVKAATEKFGLKYATRRKPARVLFERGV